MSSVVISGDTSGAITLSAPAVSGTNTLTLPATTGTLLASSSPQSGGVIQVVSVTNSTQTSTTSTTPTSTGLAASITPKFSTSKILVLFNFKMTRGLSGTDGSMGGTIKIYRNASSVHTPSAFLGFSYPLSTASYLMAAGNYLDSPATVSSTTYTIYFNTTTAGAQVGYCSDGDVGSITLMEIAA